ARHWGAYGRLFEGSERLIAASVALSVAQSLLLLPVALLVKHVFDTAIPRGDTGGVVVSGLVIIALYLASAGFGLWTVYVVVKAKQVAITNLRVRLLQKVLGFSRAYFDRHSAGELQSIIVQDSERLNVVSSVLFRMLLPAAIVSLGL